MNMKKYVQLLRVKHYLKNFLVFLPLIFSGKLLEVKSFSIVFFAYLSFCFIASAVYIFNDLSDIEKDRLHPVKKYRPLAAGTVSKKKAGIIFVLLIIGSLGIQALLYWQHQISLTMLVQASFFLLLYLVMNLFYSKWAKNIPIIDIMILTFGFLLRVFFGGSVISVAISNWLYLTILAFSLYLVIGKRKGELLKNKEKSRLVLKYYSKEFLDKFMYLFLALTLVFYSLWCTLGVSDNGLLIYSIFFVIFIVMKYSLIIEGDSLADPVDVLLSDKILIVSCLLYALYMGVVIYG